MSVIYKCDRCGALMEKERSENELYFTGIRNSRWGYDTSMHLCDSCIKKFWTFMGKLLEEKSGEPVNVQSNTENNINDGIPNVWKDRLKEMKG